MNAMQPSALPELNLADNASTRGTFTVFLQAIEKAGLKDVLNGKGPFTLLAPTDAAFDNLPVSRLDELFLPENKEELARLVNYHVIKGRRSTRELGSWRSVRTASGLEAPITRNGENVTIDGALITTRDLYSSNGILHGIDKVNIPMPKQR